MNLKNMILTERTKTQNVIYDSIYMKHPDQADFRDGNRLVVARSWVQRGMTTNGYKVSFWNYEDVLQLDIGD